MIRKGLQVGATMALLGMAMPQTADAETLQLAADLVENAIAEHRLFQTCMSLLPREPAMISNMWTLMANDALEVLAIHPGTESLSATLRASLEPGALVPPLDTSYGALREYCLADPDWSLRLQRLEIIQLPRDLELLLDN